MNIEFSLGPRLRTLRKERSVTQRELTSRAGISANAVSLIERDEISPSVATLQRLAAALNVRMSYFFDEDVQMDIMHVRAGDRPSITSKGVMIGSIGKRLRGQELEPFFISLAPGSESGKRYVIHSGHELVYCLRGKVEYEIDDNVYLLEEGDFLLFEAELPHHWRNATEEEKDPSQNRLRWICCPCCYCTVPVSGTLVSSPFLPRVLPGEVFAPYGSVSRFCHSVMIVIIKIKQQ